jgi:hypothetical protein
MINKHFFKILFAFLGMLILGIIILFLINHFEGDAGQEGAGVTAGQGN